MDFKLQMGRLLAILYLCSMWPSVVKCITTGYFFHVLDGVGVGLF